MPRIAKRIIDLNEFKSIITEENIMRIDPKDIPLLIHFDECYIEEPTTYPNGLTISWVHTKKETDTYPIYFAVYIDKKDRIRAFLPKHGNLYNPWTATAFGDEKVHNDRYSISNMPKRYYKFDKTQYRYKETKQYHKDFDNLTIDKKKMENELLKYVTVED